MALTPKQLQLSEGGQGTFSVTVVPEGSPVTWVSSNVAYATVDDGVVTAVSPGVAIIIASITVDGVTYEDAAQVTVEAAPIGYRTVFTFTNDEFFNDEANWLQKLYTDETRETYMYKAGGEDYLVAVYDESGSPSSLHVDSRIAMQDVTLWDWDINKDYALRVVTDCGDIIGSEDDNWSLNFKLTTAGDNFFTSDGDTVIKANQGEVFIPLLCRDSISLPRLMSIQIKTIQRPGDNYNECAIVLELVELL